MMKVLGVKDVVFKSVPNNVHSVLPANYESNEIKELKYVTPDFGIKTPQKYTKLGTYNLSNGNQIHSYKLANGYKVNIVPMEGSPAIVKSYVNVGSMNETANIKGISHFLEHMAFNGTNGENGHIKLETGDSFKKIDELGGWTNASTNYAITDYVNSTPLLEDGDIETQIKVQAAMIEDMKLSNEMITKEKGPVSSEINMILDDTETIAMDQTVRTLFNIKNPADELVGGSVKHIKNLTRKDIVNYYNKYYTPDNINIVITGDVNQDEVIKLISKNFISNKVHRGEKYEEKLAPIQKTIRKDFLSSKAKSTQILLGFVGAKNNDIKERILFNIVNSYINSPTSELIKNLKYYNTDFSTGSEKISTNPYANNFVYLGTSCNDNNTEAVIKTLFETIHNFKPISQKELDRIKENLKCIRENTLDNSYGTNNIIGTAVLDNNLEYITKYDEILDSISVDEVNDAFKKIFNMEKAAVTVIHPQKKSKISFMGKTRMPLNEYKISQETLNNYDIGLYSTKSNNFTCNLDLVTDIPYAKKAGVRQVLNEIYSMGTANIPEDNFNKYIEENNIDVSANVCLSGIRLYIDGNVKNYNKGLKLAKELLYNPRIDNITLEKAKTRVKDKLERTQDTADSLYNNYYAQFDNYRFSRNDILNTLDSITLNDVKELHKYILNNSRGIIAANLPENQDIEVRSKIEDFALNLKPVNKNNIRILDVYKEQNNSVVLKKANSNSQADINETFRFKCDNSLKEDAAGYIMNSILSSSSIGLFDILREKENLAYSVHSYISTENNIGKIVLSILTTTDNKGNKETNFDNVKKSIDGFNRQIKALIDGKFTEKDLENAKRSYKADLLNQEGIYAKVDTISRGLDSIHGIKYYNNVYNEIDNITKNDIINMAKKVFANKPVYSITATKETLEANKYFLDNLVI